MKKLYIVKSLKSHLVWWHGACADAVPWDIPIMVGFNKATGK